MTRLPARIAPFACALTPAVALAHAGHAATIGFAAGFTHPFSGLDHLLAMVAVGLWAAQLGGRALWLLPATFLSCALMGALLPSLAGPMPGVEAGILASVAVLGLLVAAARRIAAPLGAALVAACALCHGLAHGAELPLAGTAGLVGFAAGTALLHVLGLVVGMLLRGPALGRPLRAAGAVIAVCGVVLAVA